MGTTSRLARIRSIYDRAYQHEGLMGTNLDPEYDRITKQALLGFAGSLAGKRILDVGAGIGSLWDLVPSDAGLKRHALDISSVGVARAMASHPGLMASVSMAEHLPYRDGCFDCVIAADTLEHIPSPACALAEIVRVLRPGGDFCASFPTPNSLWRWGWNRLIRRPANVLFFFRLAGVLLRRTVLFGRPDFQPVDHDMGIDEWQAMLENARFAVAQTLEWPPAPEIPIVYLVHATCKRST